MKSLMTFLLFALFLSCTDSKTQDVSNTKENISKTQPTGLYEVFDKKNNKKLGFMIFSIDEISFFSNGYDDKTIENVGLTANWNYYIEGKSIFTCTCTSSDCLDKSNFSNAWDISSFKRDRVIETVVLQNRFDDKMIWILTKDKSRCLEVKDWE